MATHLQRLTAITNGLVDGTATTGQKTAVADAFVANHADEIEAAGYVIADLTNEQKAKAFVVFLKRYVKYIVKANNTGVKSANETAETARLAIGTAIDTAETAAETDWPNEVEPPTEE